MSAVKWPGNAYDPKAEDLSKPMQQLLQDLNLLEGPGTVTPLRNVLRSEFLKVAHHGSVNGSTDEIWNDLLVDRPVAALTQFHRGNVHLPTPEQVTYLGKRTTALFSTSRLRHAEDLTPATRAARIAAGDLPRSTESGLGHIRARKRLENEAPWLVACFGDAKQIGGAALNSLPTPAVENASGPRAD